MGACGNFARGKIQPIPFLYLLSFFLPSYPQEFLQGETPTPPFHLSVLSFSSSLFSVLPFPLSAWSIVDSVCLFVRPSVCLSACVELCRLTFQICTSTVSSDSRRTWHTNVAHAVYVSMQKNLYNICWNFDSKFFWRFFFKFQLPTKSLEQQPQCN